ncbi:hypothetical protein [Streptococcus suis]|uniref:Uncharacterized protein n=1 Tax=Streptococcus suis TaxID=1307 RepID=A0A0Z8JGF4_STRSU|nr:hypothetical protein [Streptococcus suis]MDY7602506.1 hypothetical protein [Streptococcus suis]NQG71050.1 hypothetical protein [Streptococcus suis]NQH61173.1 hypothetical protein [Streptococcus suis]NQN45540.1 hypothetical protein [Streptococcus suis]NQN97536.1 hypothetical protein [Streptococcus suis]
MTGSYKEYCEFCEARYSGKFTRKEGEGLFEAFDRYLEEKVDNGKV